MLGDETLTVSQLGRRIQGALDDRFPDEIWVEGELHGLKRSSRGHVYFDLVEPGALGAPPVASLPVVLFDQNRRGVNALLKRQGGVRMADGMAIRIRASLDFYPPQGRLQLRMTGIDPTYTLGRMAAERERVLRALVAEGLLDRNRRLAHPLVPLRIGLVTSAESAAWADFLDELRGSPHAFRVVHADARMQGADAERSIVAAVQTLRRAEIDVVALVRGGGARTDLACFDSELVARTLATLDVPLHTGIGHEIDRSVADEVAFTAHKTPTACAAALVAFVDRYLAGLDERARAVAEATTKGLERERRGLHGRVAATTRAAQRGIDRQTWRLGEQASLVALLPERVLASSTAEINSQAQGVSSRAQHALRRAEQDLTVHATRAAALDPDRVLARGWTITRQADGRVARASDLMAGSELLTTFADGEARSTVFAVEPGRRATDSDRPDSDPPDAEVSTP